MINTSGKNIEEVIDEFWVLLQIEMGSLVVQLHIGNLDGHVLELHMIPSFWRMTHHCSSSIVELIILNIQVCKFLPVLLFVANTDKSWNVDTSGKKLEMLHKLLWTVFGIQSAQFCEDAHMGTLQTEPTFHKCDELIETTPVLVVLTDLFQIINLQRFCTIKFSGLVLLSQTSHYTSSHNFPTKQSQFLTVDLGTLQ
jgi:hypothetical protein